MERNTSNSSNCSVPWMYDLEVEDISWIITSTFMIFTMQTGFGMLESGCVSTKNEVNIMMKNVVDIVLGGFTYWVFGYAFSFGGSEFNTPLISFGDFFVDPTADEPLRGSIYTAFLFQMSFATTATTIVSGAMAERCNFKAYCLYSFLNTIVYCIPAGWIWGQHGFLKKLGTVDIAGSGPVHLVGGVSAFASAFMLGPRLNMYGTDGQSPVPMGTPVNAVLGLFVLWWGWLAFNSGSTYGFTGQKYVYAAKAAVMTMMASFGGGLASIFYTLVRFNGKSNPLDIINGILGSLVSVTAGCFLYRGWESILIGSVGSLLVMSSMPLFHKFEVDDPVGASSVHGIGGIWGVLAVGIFAEDPYPLQTTNGRNGLFKDGSWYLLGVQTLSVLCLTLWSFITSICLLWFVNLIVPIRMDKDQEIIGADFAEHGIKHTQTGILLELNEIEKSEEMKKELIRQKEQNSKVNKTKNKVNKNTPKNMSHKQIEEEKVFRGENDKLALKVFSPYYDEMFVKNYHSWVD